jgi:hypothetical protein
MYMTVWNTWVIMICAPVVRGQIENILRNPFPDNVMPRAIIRGCPVPVVIIRSVPIAMVEDYVNIHTGRIIGIRSRDDHQLRRGRDKERRRNRHIDADTDIHFCPAASCSHQKYQG